jgi:hypothetical protein
MNKQHVRNKIEYFFSQEPINLLELKTFHRQLEKQNAKDILEDNDDQVMKDVEFLTRSAIFLHSLGTKPEEWKLQLNAALGILDSSHVKS